MPDAGSHSSVIPKGETETLFISADRAVGNVTTQEFDMKGAVYGIFIQDSRIVDNSTRSQQGTPVTWSAQDVTDTIDTNITNGTERVLTSSSEMIIDWGSIAARIVTCVFQQRMQSNNPANSLRFDMEFSDDDISYGDSQLMGVTTGAVKTVSFNLDLASETFRYTKVVVTEANDTVGTMRELYEKATAGGSSQLTFEVRDTARSDWKVLNPTTAITLVDPINSGATVTATDALGQGQINELIMPTADIAGIKYIRAVLTTGTLGVSDTSVILIKVNTLV